jgi:hypothetical protein
MLKKILIGAAVLVVIFGAALFYLNNRNRALSPPGSASLSNDDLTVSITYSRPSVRERLVFGTKEQKALQPYGEYWRLGANESTEITFNQNVIFNSEKVEAGTYRIYAVPGPETFEIGLNSELGKWGYSEPDYKLDVVKTKVPVQKLTTPVEQFTITLTKAENGIDAVFDWSDVRLTIPVRKDQ